MSHLSKEEIEDLNAELLQLSRQEALRHLLLCGECSMRAMTLQLLDEQETWKDGPSAFSRKVLQRAVRILEERGARTCEEQAEGEASETR